MYEGIYIDTNLIVLLIVGLTKQELISKHRRTREFTVDDYKLLFEFLSQYRIVFVTPNTLTEASNLVRQHAEPERSQILYTFRNFVNRTEETAIASSVVVDHVRFPFLGLTDIVLLRKSSPNTPLITVDLDLYLETVTENPSAAINFNHMRDKGRVP